MDTMRRFGTMFSRGVGIPALAAALLLFPVSPTHAMIPGVTAQSFSLTASSGKVTTSDGSGLFFWGYANGTGVVQYPGPTMIVTQGQLVTVTLANQLTTPVSIVFPGQSVTATGGVPGLLTREVVPGGAAATYSFTPPQPGTYLYHSGTEPDLQVEMGLVGTLIVRPSTNASMAGCDPDDALKVMPTAYGDCRSAYDYEYLFLLTEMAPKVHELVELGLRKQVKTTDLMAFSWFMNGRGAPDTMSPDNAGWLPHQPYSCMPLATPRDRVLLRVLGAGRDNHPLHTHGNNLDVIARDGRLLATDPGSPAAARTVEVGVVPDLALSNFTINVQPGGTYDGIFSWTGRELGWDFFGHTLTAAADPSEIYAGSTLSGALPPGGLSLTVPGADGGIFPSNHRFRAVIWTGTAINGPGSREVVVLTRTGAASFAVERAAEGTTALNWAIGANLTLTDHGTKFPVSLPDNKDLTFGQFYSGSPYLGSAGTLPPGEGGFNPAAGFAFMWHSHTEKELTNNNVFPGGLMTMFIVLPPGTPVE